MKKINIDAVYILHHPKLIDRKKFMLNQLIELGIENEVTWVEDFGPEEIKEEYDLFVNKPIEDTNTLIEQLMGNYINEYHKVSIGNYSLCLKHKYCYQDQIKNKFDNILILEDDAVLGLDFIENFNNAMDEFINFEKHLEFLVIGGFRSWKSNAISENKNVFYEKNLKTRCTQAQVCNINFSEKALPYMEKINNPIDFKLNEIFQLENISVAWFEPSLDQFGFKTEV
jgi:GR25 family glycosyltransferase involved in LPS biosynthesis